jgi:hypothetical protein
VDHARVRVDRHRAMLVRFVVMIDGITAWAARMRAEDSDQTGRYRADQRQKDDCLDHRRASLRMISPENRCPLFWIMLNPSSG